MKILGYVLVVLISFAAGAASCWIFRCGGGTCAGKPVSESGPQPVKKEEPAPKGFSISPARHDFGSLREGEMRSTVFKISRPGNKPFRMGRLYSPCPCVAVKASPRAVKEGAEAPVTVEIHSLTLEGDKSFPVYVEILSPEKGVLRADVTAQVNRVPSRVLLQPESFHMGAVTADKNATVKLTNLTGLPHKILAASTEINGASVSVKGGGSVGPGREVEIVLSVRRADLKAGPLSGSVRLSTDDPLHAVIDIPVDGMVR